VWRYTSTLALYGDEWSASHSGRFTPEEKAPPVVYWTGLSGPHIQFWNLWLLPEIEPRS